MTIGMVEYGVDDSNPEGRPSPIIWGDCPADEIQQDPAAGIYMFEDFQQGVVAGTTLVLGQRNGLVAYADSNDVADILQDATTDKGIVKLDTDGTDDDNTVITTGDNVVGLLKITSGQQTGFWFEARVKVSTITTGDIAMFVGLTQEGQAGSGTPLGALGVIGDIDHLGFNIKEDDGNAVDLVHTKAGVVDGGADGVHVPVVDTYVNLGLYYNVFKNVVECYVDGVQVKTADIDCSATNFPSGEELAVTIAVTSGANGADGDGMTIDWFAVASGYRSNT